MKAVVVAKNFSIGLIITLVFFCVIEGSFRLFSIGKPSPLFVSYKADPDQLVFNPKVAQSVFFRKDENLIPQIDPFEKVKTDGTFRVFVLGASTGYGFPYTHATSFPRILERSLQSFSNNKNVEVVNLSLTAINTYTLREFAEQLSEYDPDLVLIYAGHNEYYGIHGVASTYSFASGWLKDLYFLSKNLYLFNWLEGLISVPAETGKPNENLMKKLSAENFIPVDSDEFEAGISQYKKNLNRIVTVLGRKNIPVYIGTLTSNLTGILPLDYSSTRDENLSSIKTYRQAVSQLQKLNTDQSIDDFETARLLDQLRFRAPHAFNEVIESLENDKVTVIDIDSTFRQFNHRDGFSNRLFLEHVHPTIHGYYLMAHCFHEAILSDSHFATFFDGEISSFRDYRDAFDSATTPLDSVYGSKLIFRLLKQWPFNYNLKSKSGSSLEEKIANEMLESGMPWAQAMDIYIKANLKNGNPENARRGAISLMQEIPLSPQPIIYYLESLVLLENWKEILDYSLIYVQREKPNYDLISKYVSRAFDKSDELDELETYLTENSDALGEFGFYLEGVLENRRYQESS